MRLKMRLQRLEVRQTRILERLPPEQSVPEPFPMDDFFQALKGVAIGYSQRPAAGPASGGWGKRPHRALDKVGPSDSNQGAASAPWSEPIRALPPRYAIGVSPIRAPRSLSRLAAGEPDCSGPWEV
jgi:hypothetical protein